MGIENINADKARVIFAALDSNRDSSISLDDFRKLCICSRCAFDASIRRPSSHEMPRCLANAFCQVLEHIVRHRFFEYGIDLMLIINAVFLLWRTGGFLWATPQNWMQRQQGARTQSSSGVRQRQQQ